MNKLILPVLFSMLSFHVSAGWKNVGKVTRLHSGHSGSVWAFSTKIQAHTVQGCTTKNQGYFVNGDLEHSERMYSLLMAAYMSGKDVAIYTTDNCLHGRPEVNAVQIKEVPYF